MEEGHWTASIRIPRSAVLRTGNALLGNPPEVLTWVHDDAGGLGVIVYELPERDKADPRRDIAALSVLAEEAGHAAYMEAVKRFPNLLSARNTVLRPVIIYVPQGAERDDMEPQVVVMGAGCEAHGTSVIVLSDISKSNDQLTPEWWLCLLAKFAEMVDDAQTATHHTPH